MFQFSLGVQGVVPSNEAVVAIALVDYGSVTAMIMFVGMLVNIALARFTKFKYIFLTSQAMLYVSCLTAVILVSAGFGNGLFTILLGGLFEGTLLTVTPALCQPFMRVITGGDTVAWAIRATSVMLWPAGAAISSAIKSTAQKISTSRRACRSCVIQRSPSRLSWLSSTSSTL